MPFENILYEKRGPVAYVTLNRPAVLNAYNVAMRDDLTQVLAAVAEDPDVQGMILAGAGRAFCAGADIRDFGTAPSIVAAREARWERDVWGQFLRLYKPVVAVLHGYALGAGLEIALFCDIRIATTTCRLGMVEVNHGIIPAAGGTQTLPRTIKPGLALEMILGGETFTAAEALRRGFVHRVVPEDALAATAEDVLSRILANDPRAVRTAKEAILRGLDLPLAGGLRVERELAARLASEQKRNSPMSP
jgi:enoyl-CoA hydratase/carnithine racemase